MCGAHMAMEIDVEVCNIALGLWLWLSRITHKTGVTELSEVEGFGWLVEPTSTPTTHMHHWPMSLCGPARETGATSQVRSSPKTDFLCQVTPCPSECPKFLSGLWSTFSEQLKSADCLHLCMLAVLLCYLQNVPLTVFLAFPLAFLKRQPAHLDMAYYHTFIASFPL